MTGVLNCCHFYDNYKQNNIIEGKNPRKIKGWVAKWQHALVTPFCDATALEADPIEMVQMILL